MSFRRRIMMLSKLSQSDMSAWFRSVGYYTNGAW